MVRSRGAGSETAVEAAAGPPRRRRLDAAARRETILAAAIPLFAANGYEQTRVSDVAALVGVTEPVIFQNFGTKADLFAAVLDRVAGDLARSVAALAAESDDVLELLAHLVTAERLDRLHDRGGFGALLRDAGSHVDGQVRDAWRRAVARAAGAVAGLLCRGQADGSIRRDVDATALAWLVLSLAQAREFRRQHAPSTPADLERELLAAVLDTLRPRAGPGA